MGLSVSTASIPNTQTGQQSELGENNSSTHQDPTFKISPRSSHPVGSPVSGRCGSFITHSHWLRIRASVARCSPPHPRSANWRAVPVSFQMKKVAIPCCGVRALKCALVKTDGLKKTEGTEGNGLCSAYFHLFPLAFMGRKGLI